MVAKKKPQTKKPVQKKKEATKVKENKQMARTEYVDTITEMCERLNESGLLDELNMIELEDDLTAERLTDLFCDAIEYVESQDKAGELDDDMVDFYEGEPWKELPDEDEEELESESEEECICETEETEEELEDEVVGEEPEPEVVAKTKVKQKTKKKVVEKIAKGKKVVVKKEQPKPEKPVKKKVINKPAAGKKVVTKPEAKKTTDFSKSNKAIVYLAWKDGMEDVVKLHKKVKEAVKEGTIRGWLSQWKRGENFPAIAKK